DILRLLETKGAGVDYHDPHVPTLFENGVARRSVAFDVDALADYDLVLITTDHSSIDYRQLIDAGSLVVDTRNALGAVRSERIVALSGRPRAGAQPALTSVAGMAVD
ncbi:MAG: UDP binding domain-containing protein, partial [Longimicrobiales bacterium]